MKDIQASEEASGHQKITTSTNKKDSFSLLSFFADYICSSGFSSSRPKTVRIRIHNTDHIWDLGKHLKSGMRASVTMLATVWFRDLTGSVQPDPDQEKRKHI
jgi:hypothetical protein